MRCVDVGALVAFGFRFRSRSPLRYRRAGSGRARERSAAACIGPVAVPERETKSRYSFQNERIVQLSSIDTNIAVPFTELGMGPARQKSIRTRRRHAPHRYPRSTTRTPRSPGQGRPDARDHLYSINPGAVRVHQEGSRERRGGKPKKQRSKHPQPTKQMYWPAHPSRQCALHQLCCPLVRLSLRRTSCGVATFGDGSESGSIWKHSPTLGSRRSTSLSPPRHSPC